MRFFLKTITVLLFLLASSTASAQFEEGNKYVKTTLLSDMSAIIQEQSPDSAVLRLGVLFSIEPGWHIYWKNSGESAIPTLIKWKVPSGWQVDELEWPAPYRFLERGDITTYGYKNEVMLISELFAPAIVPGNRELIEIEAVVRFLVCNDICVPGEVTLKQEIPFGPEEVQGISAEYEKFNYYQKQTPKTSQSLKENLIKNIEVTRDANDDTLNVDIALAKEQLANSKFLSQDLQLFPTRQDNLNFIDSSFISNENEAIVRARYKIENNKVVDSIVGNLAINGNSLTDSTVHHGSTVNIEWNSEIPKDLEETPLVDTPKEELRYRYISHSETAQASHRKTVSSNEQGSVLIALLFGFLAGVVLNFMPCVLPIISIKIMSFISHANRPRSYIITSAAAYSAGILATFLSLAIAVISLRNVGTQLGWGFQFQYPSFIIALAVIVFVLALGFFDLFHFTLPYLQKANRGVSKLGEGHSRTFLDGVLATLLSTPCTAPFLGTALAFSFSAPNLAVITVFLSIGLGLAFPYILLSLNKRLVAFLPKPGDWMYRVREIMGFFLLATVIWLLYILSKLTVDGVVWLLFLLLLVFVSFWFTGKASDSKKHLTQWTFIAIIAACTWMLWPRLTQNARELALSSNEVINWQAYSPESAAELVNDGQLVFIDFTAEWCITCKANEKLVISSDEVVKAITQYNVVALKADWTDGNTIIGDALSAYGGNGVPFYVVLSKDREIILPSVLTPGILVNAFKEAQANR